MNEEFKEEVEVLKSKISKENRRGLTVFYGSSSIRLWQSLSKDFPELNCLNLAFGGSQINDCIAYYSELLAKTSPERIIFYAGDNDIGDGCSSQEVLARFKRLHEKINSQFPLIPFVFISIKPSPCRKEYLSTIKETNSFIRNYLFNYSNTTYVDVYSQMMLSSDEIDASLFLEDDLHLNQKGYAIWGEVLREGLNLVSVED